MRSTSSSPWLALTLIVVGLIVGYSIVIFQHRDTAFANAYRCPMHCTGENCMKHCTSGDCAKNCPNCQKGGQA